MGLCHSKETPDTKDKYGAKVTQAIIDYSLPDQMVVRLSTIFFAICSVDRLARVEKASFYLSFGCSHSYFLGWPFRFVPRVFSLGSLAILQKRYLR